MAAKRYQIMPIDVQQFDVQVWVGWRWFGSWEPSRIDSGKIATFTTASEAEKYIQGQITADEWFATRRIKDEEARRSRLKFQAENPPYEFPGEITMIFNTHREVLEVLQELISDEFRPSARQRLEGIHTFLAEQERLVEEATDAAIEETLAAQDKEE